MRPATSGARPSGPLSGAGGAELGPLDLAARRLWELIGELDDARELVGRRRPLHVLLELPRELLGGLAVAEDDDRPDDGAALGVRRRHRRRLGDAGVGDERRLDLEWADPVAGGQDQVVAAPLVEEVAVVVGANGVARRPPLALEALAVDVAAEERRAGRGADL